jgi:hypothetical protein
MGGILVEGRRRSSPHGLTSTDMFLSDRPDWQWAFGRTLLLEGKSGMCDTRPLFRRTGWIRAWGYRANDKLYHTRVRKMMNKYVAVMYYGIPFSDDPRSTTYSNIGGLADLDRMGERIPVPKQGLT